MRAYSVFYRYFASPDKKIELQPKYYKNELNASLFCDLSMSFKPPPLYSLLVDDCTDEEKDLDTTSEALSLNNLQFSNNSLNSLSSFLKQKILDSDCDKDDIKGTLEKISNAEQSLLLNLYPSHLIFNNNRALRIGTQNRTELMDEEEILKENLFYSKDLITTVTEWIDEGTSEMNRLLQVKKLAVSGQLDVEKIEMCLEVCKNYDTMYAPIVNIKDQNPKRSKTAKEGEASKTKNRRSKVSIDINVADELNPLDTGIPNPFTPTPVRASNLLL